MATVRFAERDPALLQRRRRQQAQRRAACARDPSDPRGAGRSRGGARGDPLWRGLPHSGRNLRPRLHPCRGSGRGPSRRAAATDPADTRTGPAQGACQPLICNLGSGTGFSNRQIVSVAESVVGHPIPVKMGPRRAGTRPYCWPAPTAPPLCSGGSGATAPSRSWSARPGNGVEPTPRATPSRRERVGTAMPLLHRKARPEPPPDPEDWRPQRFRARQRPFHAGRHQSSRAGAGFASWPRFDGSLTRLTDQEGVDCTTEFASVAQAITAAALAGSSSSMAS